jgi:hypothetical protein
MFVVGLFSDEGHIADLAKLHSLRIARHSSELSLLAMAVANVTRGEETVATFTRNPEMNQKVVNFK